MRPGPEMRKDLNPLEYRKPFTLAKYRQARAGNYPVRFRQTAWQRKGRHARERTNDELDASTPPVCQKQPTGDASGNFKHVLPQ